MHRRGGGQPLQALARARAVLFDLDNTLIPTRRGDEIACQQTIEYLSRDCGVPRSDADHACRAYLAAFRARPDDESGDLDAWRSALWRDALSSVGWAHLTDTVYATWLRYRLDCLRPSRATLEAMRTLRDGLGVPLALITNGPSCAQWEKVRRLGVHAHVDACVVSGDLPWEKPHVEIFRAACRALGAALGRPIEPRDCVMVGDKLETDILGAQRAGCAAAVYVPLDADLHFDTDDTFNGMRQAPTPLPDFVVADVAELVQLMVAARRKVAVPAAPAKAAVSRRRFLDVENNAASLLLEYDGDGNSNASDGS